MTTPQPDWEGVPVLLVDDDPTSLDVLSQALAGLRLRILVARSGEAALKAAGRIQPWLVLLDVVMPGLDGFETCRRLKGDPQTVETAVIFLSALDESRDKVRGLEVGAVDFISKPVQSEEVVARVVTHLTIQRLRRELQSRNSDLARELAVAQKLLSDARGRVEGPLLGTSPAVRALRESILSQSNQELPLLITGPLGAGHEATARAVHHASRRSRHAFIHVNCGLVRSGQDAGILSAAPGGEPGRPDSPRMSLLAMADQGTLYLEEVQRLPTELQDELVDYLDTGRVPEGGSGGHCCSVRIIACCSAPLSVSSGFAARLLARLEANQIRVPSLAERREDVPELARFFTRQTAQRLGSIVEGISERSLRLLSAYRWPGGIRELQNLIERSVMATRSPWIEVDEGQLDDGLPLGSYRLLEKLGEGGMGEVWRARHHLLARPCAVKLIRAELWGDRSRESTAERFRREARTISALTSPNTVRLYDFGLSETGMPYFVMELLEGVDLHAAVSRTGPMPPERVVSILGGACRSLAEAHEKGVLHRDVKPQNLFLCRLGIDCDVVKLLDFGLAKSLKQDESELTHAGVLTGTPAYMPPERALNGPVSARSDLYSLGCVAYFMLTGRPIFEGEPLSVMIQHVRSEPDPPSKYAAGRIPVELEQLILLCLEKDPHRRPASARELLRLLSQIPLSAVWDAERAERWWREHILGPQGSESPGSSDRTEERLWS